MDNIDINSIDNAMIQTHNNITNNDKYIRNIFNSKLVQENFQPYTDNSDNIEPYTDYPTTTIRFDNGFDLDSVLHSSKDDKKHDKCFLIIVLFILTCLFIYTMIY